MTVESPPPRHDLDAEASVLSAVLLYGETIEDVRPIYKDRDVHYSGPNGRIWQAMCALHDAGKPIDVQTVATWLRNRQWYEDVGGAKYLAQLIDATPSISNVEEYARTVADLARLRVFQTESHKSAAMAYGDVGDDINGFMSKRLETLAAIAEGDDEQDGIMLGDLMTQRFKEIQEPEKHDKGIRVRTGITILDRRMGVMKGGEVLFIGAHSGVGKTSLAKNIAVSVAANPGYECMSCGASLLGSLDQGVRCDVCNGEDVYIVENHVCFFSPEMTENQLHDSIVFSESKAKMPYVDFNGRTHLPQESAEKVMAKANMLSRLPIKIFCKPSVRYMANIRLKTLAHKRRIEGKFFCNRCSTEGSGVGACGRCGCEFWKKARLAAFVTDYVQLLKPGGPDQKRCFSREQEVATVGRMVKELAKETMSVGINLGQLNKDSKKEKRKPILDDIRESSSPGHDADKSVLIYNPAAMDRVHDYSDTPETGTRLIDCVDLIIAKCRSGGRPGIVRAAFYPEFTLFADWPEGMPMPENAVHGTDDGERRRR